MGLPRPTDLASVVQTTQDAYNQIEQIEPWRYPADLGAYVNTWADAGAGALRVRYRRTINGLVFFEGQPTKAIKPAAEVIFTLPTGYWPQNSIHFLVPDPYAAFGQGTEISASAAGIKFEGSAAPGGGPVAPHIVISYTAHKPR